MTQMPTSIYLVIGILVIFNMGTIITVLVGAGKGLWWLSKLEERVKKTEKDVDHAHVKIRNVEQNIPFLKTKPNPGRNP